MSEQAVTRKRSTFLTVLCILTFIGSGWGIYKGLTTYLMANPTAATINTATKEANREMQNELAGKDDAGSRMAKKMFSGMGDFMNAENLKYYGLSTLVCALFTLGGALLMWRLNRNGFWLYLLGTAASIFAPMFIFGSGNIFAIITTMIPAFFGVLFVILYGVCLKEMKPVPLA